ncbi:MAG: N-acetylmuramoyl-L-alanine amidase [Lachnospiraceae bacterium]|nr:N-acetylmuramoyl-L-alanine amidase [Lachnospiraceae bacterium]
MGIMLIVSMFFVGKEAAEYVNGSNVKNMERCVVIDAGHGGDDPGKIGINDALEKEINLQIAFRVKEYLEQNDIRVIMTRETDEGLYDRNVSNKKVQDMKRRLEIIDKASPEVTVSIHQNSYPEESIHGAQVFYYNGSVEGQKIAQKIQEQFIKKVDGENKRQIKANDSYYLLKKTATPIVIVECGFLSNYQEAENLCKEEYQEKVAWAICMGIMQYLNNK